MREMKKFSWRPIAVVGVLLATLGGFIYYFVNHPSVREQLTRTSPKVIIILQHSDREVREFTPGCLHSRY
jgi:hypothetical protein